MKTWYTSRTLWTNIVATAGSVAFAFGLDLGLTPENQTAIVTGALAIANIILRLVTTTAIK